MARPRKEIAPAPVVSESASGVPEKEDPSLRAQRLARERVQARQAKIAKAEKDTWERVREASEKFSKVGGVGLPYKEDARFVPAIVLGGEFGPIRENGKELDIDPVTKEMREDFNLWVRVFSYKNNEIGRAPYNWAMYDEWLKTQKGE